MINLLLRRDVGRHTIDRCIRMVMIWSAPSGMTAVSAGVCVFLSLLAVFPFLLWLPGGEGEKGERVSTSPLR